MTGIAGAKIFCTPLPARLSCPYMRGVLFFWFTIVMACGGGAGDTGDDGPEPQPLCSDTCRFARDGECDDGGPGADFAECALGTDCADCGPREGTTTCTCDTSSACEPGCTCDPDCGTLAIGGSCECGPGVFVCSETQCATGSCLWGDGGEGYCSQECGACPSGFTCVDFVGVGTWCQKIPTSPPCGTCTHSSDCEAFPHEGFSVAAGCFGGRCRERCTPGTTACDCVASTPAGGDGTGFCANDGC